MALERKRLREQKTRARVVYVYAPVNGDPYVYRFVEEDGKAVIHDCQRTTFGRHPTISMTDPIEIGFPNFDVALTVAITEANDELAEWTREKERETKIEAERKADKARAEAERDRLNKERAKEEERKRSKATYIGIIGFCVVMVGACSIFSVSALWGTLIAGAAGIVFIAFLLYLNGAPSDSPSGWSQQTSRRSYTSTRNDEDEMDAFKLGTLSGYYGENGPAFLPPNLSKMTDRQKGMFLAGMQNGNRLPGHK